MTASSSRALESRTLVVGIGSPHGDDQIGWAVMRQLALQTPGDIEIKTASQPAELLDWIQEVDQLIICDACQADGVTGDIHRWQWPTDSIAARKHAGSHDLSLPFVLSLAERLGNLPQRVIVWGVEVGDVSPGAPLSEAVQLAIYKLVKLIIEDLLVTSSGERQTEHLGLRHCAHDQVGQLPRRQDSRTAPESESKELSLTNCPSSLKRSTSI